MRKEFCRRSWLMGLALGLCGKPLGGIGGEKVPVAYLYNGMQLPDINMVWTDAVKETHPYAYVGKSIGFSNLLYLTSAPVQYNGRYSLSADGSYVVYTLDLATQEWKHIMTSSITAGETFPQVPVLVWASADVTSTSSGTVKITASEPIPVYE